MVYFDDSFLRDYIFLDPPWLCALLKLATSTYRARHHSSTQEHKSPTISTIELYAKVKSSFRQFDKHVVAMGGDVETGTAMKLRLFRECLLNLLRKHELALPYSNRMLLLPSALPDEYSLRADYPGACVKVALKPRVDTIDT